MGVDLKLQMKTSRRELQSLVPHEFRLGRKTTETTSNMCGMIGKQVLVVRTVHHGSHRFKSRNFELDDLPHTGRSLQVEMDLLEQPIEEGPTLHTRCLVERLRCSHVTAETHLHGLGKMWKCAVWMPNKLSPFQLQHRIDACVEL